MNDNEGIAAWIICEDLLVKVKAELANEAIITLQNEVKAGRMKVNGKLVSTEVPSDAERDLFVANEIAKESETMLHEYSRYIKDKEADRPKLAPGDVEKIENAKRLMLAVEEIAMLIHYRTIAEEWILEIEGIPNIDDPARLLSSTMHGKDDTRFSVLDLALKRKSLIKERIFTEKEREIMLEALKGADPGYPT